MTIVRIPYGTTKISVEIPDENFYFVAWSRSLPGTKYADFELNQALLKAEIPLDEILDSEDHVIVIFDSRLPWWAIDRFKIVLEKKLKEIGVKRFKFVRSAELYKTNISQEAIKKGADVASIFEFGRKNFVTLDLPYLGQVEIWEGIFEYNKKIFVAYSDYHEFWGYSSYVDLLVEGLGREEGKINIYRYLLNTKAYRFDPRIHPILRSLSNYLVKNNLVDYFIGNIFNIAGELVRTYADAPFVALRKVQKFIDGMYRAEFTQIPDIVLLSAGGYPNDHYWWWAIRAILRNNQGLKNYMFFISECKGALKHAFSVNNGYLRVIIDAIAEILDGVSSIYVYGDCAKTLSEFREDISEISNVQEALNDVLAEVPHAKVLVAPHGDETYLVRRKI